MMSRGFLVGLLLSVWVPWSLSAVYAGENDPGPFVEKKIEELGSPDGRISVRKAFDRASGRAQLSFVEQSSGRIIWSTTYTFFGSKPQAKKVYFSPHSKTGVVRDAVIYSTNDPLAQVLFIDLNVGRLLTAIPERFERAVETSFSPDGRIATVEDLDRIVSSRGGIDGGRFYDLETGNALFNTTYNHFTEGDLVARVNTDRRTVGGSIGTTRSFSFNLPSTPPSMSITSPAGGTRVARGSSVTVNTFATDNVGVSRVDLRVTGAGIDSTQTETFGTPTTPASPSFAFTVPADAPYDAPITLTATATDGAAFQASASVTLQVERAPPPLISQVQPSSGPLAGGTTVILQGERFQPGATVAFGGRSASNVNATSPTSMFATTPAGAAAGLVAITVTNPNGQSVTLSNAFTYIEYPPIGVTIEQLDALGFPTIRGLVKVLDAALKPIQGLTAANFTISENGTGQSPLTIEAQGGNQPVSVAIVIDTSGSIDDAELSSINSAASHFVDLLKVTDRAAVIKFSTNVFVVQSFTSDKAAVKAAINGPRPERANTALYDGVYAAAGLIASEGARRGIIVLTDGRNTAGAQTLQGAIDRAKVQKTPVYPLGLGNGIDANSLNRLAIETGGQLYIAPTTDQLQSVFAAVSGAIEARYRFTYTSSNPRRDGTTRLVVVRVSDQGATGSDARSYDAPTGVPNATILDLSPNPAPPAVPVSFRGAGSDPDGTVVAYEWRSSLEGVLSQAAGFVRVLSPGHHTIRFRVQDNEGNWSPEVTRSLVVASAIGFDGGFGPNRHDPEQTAVGEPVNVVSGNMYLTTEDLSLPGIGLPLRFARTYNSQSSSDGPMGVGWTHTFMARVERLAEDLARLQTETGGALYFTRGPTGSWTAPTGEHSTLAEPPSQWEWRQRDGTRYLFEGTGRLAQISDRNGNTIRLSYDASGRLVRVDGTSGQFLTLAYTAAGRVSQVRDSAGRAWRYGYDLNGNLVRVTDPSSADVRYEFADPNDAHNLTRLVDGNGHPTTWTYTPQDQVSETSGEGGARRLALGYDPVNRRTTIPDSLGRKTVKEYNAQGVVTREVGPLGQETRWTWDGQLNRTSVTDALGRTTTMTYDEQGNLTSVTDPVGGRTQFEYAAPFSLLTKLTDAASQVTTYTYDSTGNLLCLADAAGQHTHYTYDAKGQLASMTDANRQTTAYAYNAQGDLVSVTDPLTRTTTFAYDALGNRTAITDPGGHTTRVDYDARNRVSKVTLPDGSFSTMTYDRVGNRTVVTDPLLHTTRSTYDGLNQLLQVADPLNNTTVYAYDTEGNLLSVSDPKGNLTRYTYDALNRVKTVTTPLNQTTAFDYDAVGNRTAVTAPTGTTVRYTYDALNRLTTITLPDGRMIQYGYDALGRRTLASGPNGAGATTYAYDAVGRLVAVDGPGPKDTVTYTYDPVGNRLSMTDPDGRIVRYEYDDANQLKSLMDPLSGTFQVAYDHEGNLDKLAYPNGVTAVSTYDSTHRLASIVNRTASGTVLASASYTYDDAGRRTQAGFLDATVAYGYDDANRLLGETRTGTNPYTISDTYDAANNRLTQVKDGVTTQYAYNAGNQLTRQVRVGRAAGRLVTIAGTVEASASVQVNSVPASVVEADTSRWTARVPLVAGLNTVTVVAADAAGNTTTRSFPLTLDTGAEALFTYDADGRLTSRSLNGEQTLLAWDALGHLTQLTYPDGKHATFTYDAEGRRIREERLIAPICFIQCGDPGGCQRRCIDVTGTSFLYDGFNVLQERRWRFPLPVTTRWVWGPSLGGGIGGLLADQSQFYHYDGAGNVIALTDATGAVTQRFAYEAFGSRLTPPTDLTQPYQFSTKRLDSTSGLYDFGVRWYDPSVGRFLSPEPLGMPDGPNPYVYVGSSPPNYIDPNGAWALHLAGAVIGGITGGISAYVSGGDVRDIVIGTSVGVIGGAVNPGGAVASAVTAFTTNLATQIGSDVSRGQFPTIDLVALGTATIAGGAIGKMKPGLAQFFQKSLFRGQRHVLTRGFVDVTFGLPSNVLLRFSLQGFVDGVRLAFGQQPPATPSVLVASPGVDNLGAQTPKPNLIMQ